MIKLSERINAVKTTGIILFIFAVVVFFLKMGIVTAIAGESNGVQTTDDIQISSTATFINLSDSYEDADGFYESENDNSIDIHGEISSDDVYISSISSEVKVTCNDIIGGVKLEFLASSVGSYKVDIVAKEKTFSIDVVVANIHQIRVLKGNSFKLPSSESVISSIHYESYAPEIADVSEDGVLKGIKEGECGVEISIDCFGERKYLGVFFVLVNELKLSHDVVALDVSDISKDSNGFYNYENIALTVTGLADDSSFRVECPSKAFSIQTDIYDGTGYIFLRPSKTGTFTVYIYADGKKLTAKVAVLSSKNSDVQIALSKSLKMTISGATSAGQLKFTSSNKSVASVDGKGNITTKKWGTSFITGKYFVSGKVVYTKKIKITVTNPEVLTQKLYINVYGAYKDGSYYYTNNNIVKLAGVNASSKVKISCSSNLLCEYNYYNSTNKFIRILPKKIGNYTVTLNVDGRAIKFKVCVVNFRFKLNAKSLIQPYSNEWVDNYSCLLLYKGEKTKLTVYGVPKTEKVIFKSSNTKVATVNSKGEVKAIRNGKAVITATLGRIKIKYIVNVSNKPSVEAIRYAKRNFNATYSQAKRMQKGYYDCSSYVWRSYASAGKYIGGSKTYAPTAANLAKWYADKGKVLFDGVADTSKMLPGDLVFECGADNGRYKGIYHVDLYQGNYSTLTVGRIKYCGDKLYNVIVVRP